MKLAHQQKAPARPEASQQRLLCGGSSPAEEQEDQACCTRLKEPQWSFAEPCESPEQQGSPDAFSRSRDLQALVSPGQQVCKFHLIVCITCRIRQKASSFLLEVHLVLVATLPSFTGLQSLNLCSYNLVHPFWNVRGQGSLHLDASANGEALGG